MKITKNSQKLISFFKNKKHINYVKPNNQTIDILHDLYNDVLEAYNYLMILKKSNGNNLFHIQTKKIHTASQITKPNNFNSNSFPELVRKHINETSVSEISYTFSLFERNIKIIFTTEEPDTELKINSFNRYVDSIIIWLYILNQYSSKQCANTLTIYFYFTSLEKQLPDSNIFILDETNVNTAFTTTCPKDSEIVVYRKEEWFKVFIHETFHNFGLDFSDMNVSDCTNHILNIFPVNSEVNLFESYTEFWAEIMNSVICSFYLLKNKTDTNEFFNNVITLIHYERIYSFFQMTKILQFMGLTYEDLYLNNHSSHILRENMYKERTNVLSYYIIKTILLNNYTGFLSWCKKHNLSLLQFKKTTKNLKDYCIFIYQNYKRTDLLKNIQHTESFLDNIYSNNGDNNTSKNVSKNTNNKSRTNYKINNKTDKYNFLLKNMRMCICELD